MTAPGGFPRRARPVLRISTGWLLVAVVTAHFGIGSAAAADDKKAREAQRRQQQTQQMMAEKARLEQEKAALAKQKDELSAEVEKKTAGLARSDAALRAKAKAEAELTAKLADLEKRHEELKRLQAETADTLRQREADKKRLEAVQAEQRLLVGRQVRMLQSCEDRNAKLYQAGSELLDKYRDKSCMNVLLEAEPVTGLKKVDAENMLQKYRDSLDAAKSAVAER